MTAHRPRFFERSVAHRRELEIFASQQIAVGGEKGEDVDARREQQRQRDQVDEDRQAGEAQRAKRGGAEGDGLAERTGRIDLAFDDESDLVEKEAGRQRRDRRDKKGEADEEAEAGEDREDRRQPGRAEADKRDEQPVESEPGDDQNRQRQRQRFDQDGAKRRREDLRERVDGVLNHEASVGGEDGEATTRGAPARRLRQTKAELTA